jgi:DNA-binding response OmpR family regulator
MVFLDSLNASQARFKAADIVLIALEASASREQVIAVLGRRGHHAAFLRWPVQPSAELHSHDLIVLEPDINDPGAMRFCQALRTFSRLPLLVMVPYLSRSRGIQALELGADSFILTPFDRRELIARCEALIRRYRYW